MDAQGRTPRTISLPTGTVLFGASLSSPTAALGPSGHHLGGPGGSPMRGVPRQLHSRGGPAGIGPGSAALTASSALPGVAPLRAATAAAKQHRALPGVANGTPSAGSQPRSRSPGGLGGGEGPDMAASQRRGSALLPGGPGGPGGSQADVGPFRPPTSNNRWDWAAAGPASSTAKRAASQRRPHPCCAPARARSTRGWSRRVLSRRG
jgi:hypothetical protein